MMSLKSQTRTNLASHESQDPHPDCMKVKTRINIKVMRIRTRIRAVSAPQRLPGA